jgi:hypothetical protein
MDQNDQMYLNNEFEYCDKTLTIGVPLILQIYAANFLDIFVFGIYFYWKCDVMSCRRRLTY